MTLQRLAILGGGAVARALWPPLRAAGIEVRVWTRDPRVAQDRGLPVLLELERVQEYDAAWILVSDSAIAEVAQGLAHVGAPEVVLHASGYYGREVLAALESAARGVLHPLISFPSGATPTENPPDLNGAHFTVSGDPAACEVGRSLAEKLGCPVFELADTREVRAAYHASAALTAAGVVALVDLAMAALPEGDPPDLGRAALSHLAGTALGHMTITGPVARGDAEVVAGHLQALPSEAAAAYRLLARRMVDMAGLDPEKAAAIRALLGE